MCSIVLPLLLSLFHSICLCLFVVVFYSPFEFVLSVLSVELFVVCLFVVPGCVRFVCCLLLPAYSVNAFVCLLCFCFFSWLCSL